MSLTRWTLIRSFHVLAAMGWVGGQLLLSAVVLPVLRRAVEPGIRDPLVRQTATRFGFLANTVLLPILAVTGLVLAWHRGVTPETLGDPGYGRLLGAKLVLVAASAVLAAAHGIMAARKPGRARPLAIAGLVSSVGIVIFATALVP